MATTLDRGLESDQPVELKVAGTRRRGRGDRILMYVLLVAIAVFFVFPLIVVLSASLKYRAEVFQDVVRERCRERRRSCTTEKGGG